jgi:hypothetical protein
MSPEDNQKLNTAIQSILGTPEMLTEALADALHECPDFEHLVKGCVIGAIQSAGYSFDLKDLPDMDHPYVLTLRTLISVQSAAIHAGIQVGNRAAKLGLELP